MLKFEDNSNYTEYDQSNVAVEFGTWSLSSDQLTINDSDTTLILTVVSVNKSDAILSMLIDESGSENGVDYTFNVTYLYNLNRE